MKVLFSPRGTGACPLCKKETRCPIRNSFSSGLESLQFQTETDASPEGAGKPLEMVIYICPYFQEKE